MLLVDAVGLWNSHNKHHFNCPMVARGKRCPSEYSTLRAWLQSQGFPVNFPTDRLLGQDLNEPNFGLKNPVDEIPVEDTVPLHRWETDGGKPEAVRNGPVVNDEAVKVPQAQENTQSVTQAVRDRLNNQLLTQLSIKVTLLEQKIEALEKELDERSECAEGTSDDYPLEVVVSLTEGSTDALAEKLAKVLQERDLRAARGRAGL